MAQALGLKNSGSAHDLQGILSVIDIRYNLSDLQDLCVHVKALRLLRWCIETVFMASMRFLPFT